MVENFKNESKLIKEEESVLPCKRNNINGKTKFLIFDTVL